MYQSKNWLEAYAKCPFYCCEYKRSVTCEGYDKGMESILNKFKTEEEKTAFVRKYCTRHNYKECKLYKMIEAKYEEGVKV